MKSFLLALIYLSSANLIAQDFIQLDTEDEEVEFNDANPDTLNAPALPENPTDLPLGNPFTTPIATQNKNAPKTQLKDPRRSVSFSYSPEIYNYDVISRTASTNVSLNSLGQYASIGYDHWSKKNWGFEVSLSHRFFLFNDLPTGIFPNSISGNFLNANGKFKFKLTGEKTYSEGLSIYLQYQYLIYDVELTVPIQTVDYNAHSIGIGFIYGMRFDKNRRLKFDLSYNPSFSYSEEPVDSGDQDSQFNFKARVDYIFPWNEHWDVFFAYRFSMRKISFNGTGTRNIESPEQKEITHSPMIGLIYEL